MWTTDQSEAGGKPVGPGGLIATLNTRENGANLELMARGAVFQSGKLLVYSLPPGAVGLG